MKTLALYSPAIVLLAGALAAEIGLYHTAVGLTLISISVVVHIRTKVRND